MRGAHRSVAPTWVFQRRRSATVSGNDDFRYTPLRSAKQDGHSKLETFRLVELLPGAASDPIQCRLSEVAIGTQQAYEAISYCWGPPEDKTNIRCNEKQLKIPSSLARALRGLRWSDRARHLWADAICIDQSDPLDKAMQVPHMRSIYSRSQRTLVWLGVIDDAGTSRISRVSRACIHICIPILGLADRTPPPIVDVFHTKTQQFQTRTAFSSHLYISLAYMLRRHWFRRAWVVQEVAVSSRVTILFDHAEYDWEEIARALKFLSSVKFPLAFLPSPQHIAAIDHERGLYKHRKSSLPGVLIRHQRCLATDQRDKIFAFAGLISPESAVQDVRVSYTDAHPPSAVYQELAVRIVTRDENLDILSGPPTVTASRVGESLPSWVPNWSVEPDLDQAYTWSAGPISLAGSEARDGLGAEARRFSASNGSRYTPEISGDTLIVEGKIMGTITYAGPSFPGVKLPNEVDRFRDIRKGWMETLQSVLRARDVLALWKGSVTPRGDGVYPFTGEPMDAVFWETVCAGERQGCSDLQRATRSWERLMRKRNIGLKGILHSFNFLGVFYATLVFFFILLRREPLVEHRLQGRYVMNRKMVRLDMGHLGLSHFAAEEGDVIFLVQGSSVPLVLRKRVHGETWRFVGDAYVHGVMGGEAWNEKDLQRIQIT
ncbi:hypothetical protein OQA88_5455 [Cercophora sp. LCS_1]